LKEQTESQRLKDELEESVRVTSYFEKNIASKLRSYLLPFLIVCCLEMTISEHEKDQKDLEIANLKDEVSRLTAVVQSSSRADANG
jgi:hypothetical protein